MGPIRSWRRMQERLGDIATIEGRVQEIAARLDAVVDTLDRQSSALATIAERMTAGANAARRVDEAVSALGERVTDLRTRLDQATLEIQADLRGRIDQAAVDVQATAIGLHLADPLPIRTTGSLQHVLRLERLGDGTLAFSRQHGPRPERVAIISQPKAGTYLLSALLDALGWPSVGVQAFAIGLHDYRGRPVEEMVSNYHDLYVRLPIELSTGLVKPGQHIVGHFEHAPCVLPLHDFRRLVCVREVRAALVSYMRWMAKPGRGGVASDAWRNLPDGEDKMLQFWATHGPFYLDWVRRDIRPWLDDPATLLIRFEAATAQGSPAQSAVASALATHLDVAREKVVQALQETVGTPTKTWSGRISTLDRFWGPRIEAAFDAAGGRRLNEILGYTDERT
jgi:hypothetical protein